MQQICNTYGTDMQYRYAIKICNTDTQYRYAVQICDRYATDMQHICNIYATYMQQICNRYAIKICNGYTIKICNGYTTDMQHICNRYTTDMQSIYAIKICRQQRNKDMQYRYARGVQEQQELCKNSKLGGAAWTLGATATQ